MHICGEIIAAHKLYLFLKSLDYDGKVTKILPNVFRKRMFSLICKLFNVLYKLDLIMFNLTVKRCANYQYKR